MTRLLVGTLVIDAVSVATVFEQRLLDTFDNRR